MVLSRLEYLDGWRGLAILLVLVSHFGGPYRFGSLGVHLFFVLSGLLTAKVLFVDRVPLAQFYRHRIARILPTLYVFLAVIYSVSGWGFGIQESPAEILATATFLRTYWPAGADSWMKDLPLAHLWTLNVEEHAYVILSAITLAAARWPQSAARLCIGLAACCAGAYAWHRLHLSDGPGAYFPTRTECAAFSILLSAGIFCWISRHPEGKDALPIWTCGAALIIAALGVALFPEKLAVQFMFVPAFLAVAINTLPRAPRIIQGVLNAPLLAWLGQRSYSIYLWQQPAHFLLIKGMLPIPMLVALAISIGIGLASYHLVERPARRWINGAHRGTSMRQGASSPSANSGSRGG